MVTHQDNNEGEFASFLALHRIQLELSGVPEYLWETLHYKLKNEIFDAGQFFGLLQADDDDVDSFLKWKVVVTCSEGITLNDKQHIYLIDHAWTFRLDQMRSHLATIPGLQERMCNMMEITPEMCSDPTKEVMKSVWKYAQTYNIANTNLETEERLPVWYIMDEFGSRIQHSDQPTARVVPFYYSSEQAVYSLLFPVIDLKEQDEITRDFVEGCGADLKSRAALLSVWTKDFEESYMHDITLDQQEPESSYFSANRLNETLPVVSTSTTESSNHLPLLVYTEYRYVRDFLKDTRFKFVDSADEADILWLASHFKNYKELSENSQKRINQFPCEHVITVKDLLCIVARRNKDQGSSINPETLESQPCWLPVTFNLKTEIAVFAAYYHARKSKEMPNYWIIKPWNLARSLDTHITEDIDCILRLATSGPKIAQQYIHRPVLFYRDDLASRVKFDVRYIILLRSVRPLKVYAYNRFWLRFANKPFELNHFDEYERHFTVMNYTATNLHQMFCHDFIKYFEEQYPSQSWSKIEKKIFRMLYELFQGAVSGEPPSAIGHNPQSRAMYAVDLMLEWTNQGSDNESGPSIQPKLLEMNWAPDCKRACNYYPEFFDDVFSVLFLDEIQNRNVSVLQ